MPTSTSTSTVTAKAAPRIPRHIRRHGHPPPAAAARLNAGFGVDLIAATQRAWPDNGPRYVDDVRESMPAAEWDNMLKEISKRARQRGRVGTSCQRAGCTRLEDEGTRGSFKRCSGCQQVMYCSRECQKSDWAVHKAVCNDLLPKDALTRLARYAMANVCLVTSLKYYARAVVGLDHDPQAGLKYCIVFTYTMINHRPSNARVFQISRVECVPTPETMQSTVPEVQAKVTDRDRLWVQLELKPDAPGIHTSYRTFERVEKWWLDLPDPLLGDPINYLTGYNKLIREDVDNQYQLRLPAE